MDAPASSAEFAAQPPAQGAPQEAADQPPMGDLDAMIAAEAQMGQGSSPQERRGHAKPKAEKAAVTWDVEIVEGPGETRIKRYCNLSLEKIQRKARFYGSEVPTQDAQQAEQQQQQQQQQEGATEAAEEGMEVDPYEQLRQAADTEQRRWDCLYLYGTDQCSNGDIFAYFNTAVPGWIEWINDSSCVVGFKSHEEALAGLDHVAGRVQQQQQQEAEEGERALLGWWRGRAKLVGRRTRAGITPMLRFATADDVRRRDEAKPSAYYATMFAEFKRKQEQQERTRRKREKKRLKASRKDAEYAEAEAEAEGEGEAAAAEGSAVAEMEGRPQLLGAAEGDGGDGAQGCAWGDDAGEARERARKRRTKRERRRAGTEWRRQHEGAEQQQQQQQQQQTGAFDVGMEAAEGGANPYADLARMHERALRFGTAADDAQAAQAPPTGH
eukprot:m51a1_g10018 hypothetical protein (440) ;mRNA; r:69114-70821